MYTLSGRLVLVQNTYPFAQPRTRFSDGLIYRFRIHPLAVEHGRTGNLFATDDEEYTIDCEFSVPAAGENCDRAQAGICTARSGIQAPVEVNVIGGDPGDQLRAFAGTRWDPFFMDASAALTTIATQTLAFSDPGRIYLDGKILSLVVWQRSAQYRQAVSDGVARSVNPRAASAA